MENEEIVTRTTEVYDRLVDETENEQTARNYIKTRQLHALLQVVEYILQNGIDKQSPMDDIFFEEK